MAALKGLIEPSSHEESLQPFLAGKMVLRNRHPPIFGHFAADQTLSDVDDFWKLVSKIWILKTSHSWLQKRGLVTNICWANFPVSLWSFVGKSTAPRLHWDPPRWAWRQRDWKHHPCFHGDHAFYPADLGDPEFFTTPKGRKETTGRGEQKKWDENKKNILDLDLISYFLWLFFSDRLEEIGRSQNVDFRCDLLPKVVLKEAILESANLILSAANRALVSVQSGIVARWTSTTADSWWLKSCSTL